MTKLTIADIADLRAYERERESFRDRIIELKGHRRIQVGPLISMVFENADTIRFQIQEMARAERMLTDEAIQAELDVYNPLIPEPGELSATLFLELTSKDQLMEWLPKLVGVETAAELRIGDGPARATVRSRAEEGHAAQLTRQDVTASVHYVRFRLQPAEVDAFEAGPVALAIDHPSYQHQVSLSDSTRRSLLTDLRGS
ncbi:MAG TPA: DUF3501 family protein [Acidimicrobiales bacterium]|nr:DUF3501 family protein [Acidimicrobiales bacterium]